MKRPRGKDWRFKITTWLAQDNPSYESLLGKLDQSEEGPQEPWGDQKQMVGTKELTKDEEWCGEQLYQLLVQ